MIFCEGDMCHKDKTVLAWRGLGKYNEELSEDKDLQTDQLCKGLGEGRSKQKEKLRAQALVGKTRILGSMGPSDSSLSQGSVCLVTFLHRLNFQNLVLFFLFKLRPRLLVFPCDKNFILCVASPSHTPHFPPTGKFCWPYRQNIMRIPPHNSLV